MKIFRKILAFALLAAMVLSLSSGAFGAEFHDVPKGSWYEPYVASVAESGLMNGTGEGTFSPMQTLSRAMFVTVLNRATGDVEAASNTVYADVAADVWYAKPIAWAESQGVVNGYSDGTFGVNYPLTREQMVTILYRYFYANQAVEVPAGVLEGFSDRSRVSAYAADAMSWAVSQGILSGNEANELNPKGTTTRAEAAAVITRFLEYAEKNSKKLTRADLEAAVMELAMGYYLKGNKIQYDSMVLSAVFDKYYGGHYRLTEGAAPEYGTSDTSIYSVCSDYQYKSYLHALGYRIFGAKTYMDSVTDSYWLHSAEAGMLLARWARDGYRLSEDDKAFGVVQESFSTTEEFLAFVADWKNTLRPGDIVMNSTHALFYVGGGYMTDVSGEKYRMYGADSTEYGGAIEGLISLEQRFLSEDGNYNLLSDNCTSTHIALIRPINALVQDDGDGDPGNDVVKSSLRALPKATQSRLRYPGMEIDRTVNVSPYGSTFTGDVLTYNVAVSNLSNWKDYLKWKQIFDAAYTGVDYENLTVTEKIPAGTEYVEGSATEGGTYEDGTVTWTFNLTAGEVKNLSYKVKVNARQGEEIVSGGGFVDNIPSNTIVNPVGGKPLSESAREAFAKLGEANPSQWAETYGITGTDTDFAKQVYAAAGLKLDLPAVQDVVQSLLEPTTMTNPAESRRYHGTKTGTALAVKPDSELKSMVLKNMLGGRYLYFRDNDMTALEMRKNYLTVGDILIFADCDETGKVSSSTVLVQVGNEQLVSMTSDGKAAAVIPYNYLKTLNQFLAMDMFVVLRPTLVFSELG